MLHYYFLNAVDVIVFYFMIGSVFWAPVSFYVFWFLKVNHFEIDERIRVLYYLAAIFLWPFVFKAGVEVAFDGLGDRKDVL